MLTPRRRTQSVPRPTSTLLVLLVLITAALLPGASQAATTGGPGPGASSDGDRSLFVAGVLGNKLSQIVTSPNGSLRPAEQFQVDSSAGSFAIAISPDGRFVYAAGALSGDISVFARTAGGSLTPVPGSPFKLGRPVAGLAATLDGHRLLATSPFNNGELVVLSVSPQGRLETLGSAALLTGLTGVIGLPAVSPDGRYAFVASYLSSRIRVFSLHPDGSVSRLGSARTGLLPVSPVVSSDGRHLYTTNEGANTVSGFRVGPDGSLSRLPGSPYRTGWFPHGISISPNGRFAYVPNLLANTISGYDVAADGVLSEMARSPFPGGSPGTLPGRAVFAPNGRTVFQVEVGSLTSTTTSGSSRVHSYAVGGSGLLTKIDTEPLSAQVYFTDGPSSVLVPDQGPTARISAGIDGRTVRLDAGSSSDPDGAVARHVWDFGDGTGTMTDGPVTVHRYAVGGRPYRVSVRVIDDEGCSSVPVFNGQVATCNGDARAEASQTIDLH